MSEVRISVNEDELEIQRSRRTNIIGAVSGILAVGLVAAGLHEGDSGASLATTGLFTGMIGGLGAVYSHLFNLASNRQNMIRRTRREAVVKSIVSPPDVTMYESTMTINQNPPAFAEVEQAVGTAEFDYTQVYKVDTGAVYVTDRLDFAVTIPAQS